MSPTASSPSLACFCLWLALMAPALLCACHDSVGAWSDDPDSPRDSAGLVCCYYDIRLSLQDGVFSNLTRAEGDAAAETLATDAGITNTDYRGRSIDESALNTLNVFVVDVLQDGTEDWQHWQHVVVPRSDLKKDVDTGTMTASVNFYLTAGTKHIYVGANLRSELVEAFAEGTNTYRASATEGYDEVISHFVDPVKGVAMFAADTIPVTINDLLTAQDPGSKDNPFRQSVTLHRMVAKVLLTCSTKDSDETYADISFAHISSLTSNILEGEDIEKYQGWCRLSSVRYKLQSTNRTTYFIQKRDASGHVLDPNYSVVQLVDWTGKEVVYRDTVLSEALYSWANDFVFYSASDIYNFTDEPKTYLTVAPYVEGQASSAYTGGFYCLENTCDNDWTSFMSADNLAYALAFWRMVPAKVITSFVAQACYTPAVIYTATSIKEGIQKNKKPGYRLIDSEFQAIDTLKAESNDQSDTFYCINGRYCYTYQGMLASIAYAQAQMGDATQSSAQDLTIAADTANYQEFTNGYCYYQEYFSDLVLSDLSRTTFYGVERNKYYLLRCTELTAPTTSETGVEVIPVYSHWSDWSDVTGDAENTGVTLIPYDD